jgi:prepilin-type N-terminal cleavage/methylation domain-containing protein
MVFMSARVRAARQARRARGFSLIELMVVIVIIGLVAALAVPTMAAARIDRNAYDDAGQIMQLLREARTRAIARGGAVLISVTAAGPLDRGTFTMYESVTVNPGGVGGSARSPVASCKAPTVWSPLNATANTGIVLVDALNLNGGIEQDADIETQLNVYNPGGGVESGVGAAFICFTPLGRVYYTESQTIIFDGMQPMLSPLEFRVTRGSGGAPVGTVRSVLLPPNGMARVFSHVP